MFCKICHSAQLERMFIANNVHGRHILSLDTFQVYKCNDCGIIFLNIEVNSSYYSKYYPFKYYGIKFNNKFVGMLLNLVINASVKIKEGVILKYFNNVGGEKLKILDIGCGNGEFLSKISNTKFEKFGIEINAEGYELCKEKHMTVFNKELKDVQFQDEFFDIVTLWHVIEHLENPIETVKLIKKILKKDGILVLATPNTDSFGFKYGKNFWFHLDSPRHLMLFNNKSLNYFFKSAGFKVVNKKNLFYDYPLDLFWSVRNSNIKVFAYLFYPLIKYLSEETNLIICETV